MSENPKSVFDPQIFLRALINAKSACGRLVFEQKADYQLYSAAQIEHEVLDVLSRVKIREKFPQITDERVKLVEAILHLAHSVEIQPEDIDPICRDPKDDIFLACAKLAQADFLVSEDKDLLDLKQHHTTRIVNVAAFLGVLESRSQS